MATVLVLVGSTPAQPLLVEPPVRLAHVGAGDGAPEVTGLARRLGWEVTVVDFRPGLLDPRRFAPGTHVVQRTHEGLADLLRPDPRTAVLIASHHRPYDLAALSAVLGGSEEPMYLGLVGARAGVAGLLADVLGDRPRPCVVHAPAGYAIGARTPAETAVSVVSEILSTRLDPPPRTAPGEVAPAQRGAEVVAAGPPWG